MLILWFSSLFDCRLKRHVIDWGKFTSDGTLRQPSAVALSVRIGEYF
jgi:hypothetical protein